MTSIFDLFWIGLLTDQSDLKSIRRIWRHLECILLPHLPPGVDCSCVYLFNKTSVHRQITCRHQLYLQTLKKKIQITWSEFER